MNGIFSLINPKTCFSFCMALLAFMVKVSPAQENLVPNPYFSKLKQCFDQNEIIPKYWFTRDIAGHPKTISGAHVSCSDSGSGAVTIPPKWGKGIARLGSSGAPWDTSNFYLQTSKRYLFSSLKRSLKPGYRYYAHFYVANISGIGVSNLGMHFFSEKDSTQLRHIELQTLNNFKPQLFAPHTLPPNQQAFKVDKFYKTAGTFKAAEQFHSFGIGVFFPMNKVDTIKLPEHKYFGIEPFRAANYALDNVGVYEIPRVMSTRDTAICRGDSVPIRLKGGEPYFLSKRRKPKDTLSTDSLTWVQPRQTTTYYINSVIRDSVTIRVYEPPQVNLGSDTTICPKDSLTLNAFEEGAFYRWNTGDQQPKTKVSKNGLYSVKVQIGSCQAFDTFRLTNHPKPPALHIKGEKAFCPKDGEPLKLRAKGDFESFRWEPYGVTGKSIRVPDTGRFTLTAKDHNGCKRSKNSTIRENCTTTLFVPSAFSPNGDGINDVFRPEGFKVQRYTLQIFNRFGAKIFETTQFENGWNGTYKGEPVPEGQYIYILEYKAQRSGHKRLQYKKGKIKLLR